MAPGASTTDPPVGYARQGTAGMVAPTARSRRRSARVAICAQDAAAQPSPSRGS
ncbi:MAG: hypothetical protein JNK42_01150 [Caedimonas sp.]|nr:hypothetical protein [Caedimonas sp.]